MKELATSIEIDAEPERVWEVLTDFAGHEQWNPFFAWIKGRAVVGERIAVAARKPNGGTFTFHAKVIDVDRPQLLRWRGKLFVRGLFDGVHEFALVPLPGGRTRLDHGERFSGLLIPLLGKVLRDTHTGFAAFDRALAACATATAQRAGTSEKANG